MTGSTEQLLLFLAVTAGNRFLHNLLLFIGHVVSIVEIFMTLNLTVSD
jgi:hypothetical protein